MMRQKISISRICRKDIRCGGTCFTGCGMAKTPVRLQEIVEKGLLVLPAAEAVEFRHGAFHLFASGVRRRSDTLNAETEVVRIRSAHQSFFQRDRVARIKIEERLAETLHAVLAGAGGRRG